MSSELFAGLVNIMPATQLIHQLCSIAVHDKDRLRCAALKAINDYVNTLNSVAVAQSPAEMHLLQKSVYDLSPVEYYLLFTIRL